MFGLFGVLVKRPLGALFGSLIGGIIIIFVYAKMSDLTAGPMVAEYVRNFMEIVGYLISAIVELVRTMVSSFRGAA